jgi:VanZ family protein
MRMRYFPTAIATTLILIAVLLPGSKIPDVGFGGIDKLAHFTMFFSWSLAIRYDFQPNFKWAIGWIAGLAFSASTEIFQIFADERTFDVWDILFDGIGLTVGLISGAWVLEWLDELVIRKIKRFF